MISETSGRFWEPLSQTSSIPWPHLVRIQASSRWVWEVTTQSPGQVRLPVVHRPLSEHPLPAGFLLPPQAAKLSWQQSPGHDDCSPNTKKNNLKVVQTVGLAGAVPYLQPPQLWVTLGLGPLVSLSPREWWRPLCYPSLSLPRLPPEGMFGFHAQYSGCKPNIKTSAGCLGASEGEYQRNLFLQRKRNQQSLCLGRVFHPCLYIQIITLDMGLFYYYHPS